LNPLIELSLAQSEACMPPSKKNRQMWKVFLINRYFSFSIHQFLFLLALRFFFHLFAFFITHTFHSIFLLTNYSSDWRIHLVVI
jgi:hypothetical protein